MEDNRANLFTIELSGVFRVTSAAGKDVTPNSAMCCAILAVIAASTGHSVSRSRLQAMFWGTSEAKQGSGSLRSALFKLRKSFEEFSEELFLIRNTHVGLANGCWNVRRNKVATTFLEGMDLNVVGAEGFEEWLLEERMAEQNSPTSIASDLEVNKFNPRAPIGLSLGILPTLTLDRGAVSNAVTEPFFEDLQLALSQLSNISIYNLTGVVIDGDDQLSHSGPSQTLMLKSIVSERERKITLQLSLLAPLTGRVVKTISPIHLAQRDVQIDAAGIAEAILGAFNQEHGVNQSVDLMPWAVLSSLFSLDAEAVTKTEAQLDTFLATQSSSVLKSLKVFSQVFKEHEGLAPRLTYSTAEMIGILEKIPTEHPHRALCESLLGYAAHMLNADNEFSAFLLQLADQRAPNLALNLDHLAVLKLSEGDLRAASEAHARCMACSGLSSWRYSYDITGAMIAMAAGDFRKALSRSNQSLMQRPKFVGALRYTMIGFAMNQSVENAGLIKSRIKRLRPEYDLGAWVEGFLERSDPIFANNVAITLKKQNLI